MTANRDATGISRSPCNVGARSECYDTSNWHIHHVFLRAIRVAGYPHRGFPCPRCRQIPTPRLCLKQDDEKVFDKPAPQLDSELAALLDNLQTRSTDLVVVDHPTPSERYPLRLPVNAVARSATYQAWPCEKPPISTPDRRKPTVATPSSSPTLHEQYRISLQTVDRNIEVLSALKMLSGFDDDISRDCTRTVNRLRSVLTQIYPSLERVFTGSTLTRTPALDLLIHYKGPTGLKKAGRTRVLAW